MLPVHWPRSRFIENSKEKRGGHPKLSSGLCTHMYKCTHVCHTHTHTCTDVYIHHRHIQIHTYTHTYIIHTCAHTHTYKYTHATHIYTYTHIERKEPCSWWSGHMHPWSVTAGCGIWRLSLFPSGTFSILLISPESHSHYDITS